MHLWFCKKHTAVFVCNELRLNLFNIVVIFKELNVFHNNVFLCRPYVLKYQCDSLADDEEHSLVNLQLS